MMSLNGTLFARMNPFDPFVYSLSLAGMSLFVLDDNGIDYIQKIAIIRLLIDSTGVLLLTQIILQIPKRLDGGVKNEIWGLFSTA
jgi:hypothetical protein